MLGGRTPALLALLVVAACGSPNPRPCLVERPRSVPLSTRPLVTRHIYTTEQVEIAITPRTFDEMKAEICQRSDFFEACAEVVTLEGNPPAKPRVANLRERVVGYILAAALDLGRATVLDRTSGELVPAIEAEVFEDTCGSRHRVGRRYSLAGTAPFLEVRDL